MVKYNQKGEITYLNNPRGVMETFLNIYCTHSCIKEDCPNIKDCRKMVKYCYTITILGNPFNWLNFFIQIRLILWNIRANEVEKVLEQFKRGKNIGQKE